MKKYLLLIGFFAVSVLTASAQDYKPFRVGIGLGYASPGGDGAKGGVLFYLEPGYRVTDAFMVGLRLESAVMARGVSISGGGTSITNEAEVSGNASYTVNGQYYFGSNNFRPFAGVGFGIYSLASASVSGTTASASASSSEFGFYPRIGFDIGHFTMQAEYNIIPSKTTEISLGTPGSTITAESKNSYFGIKAGFFIGGGKR
ncbi:MAG: outer membrane beta-barrel protein [Cyclobacteriaceae bacterium]